MNKNIELQYEVEQFLYHEAELLDGLDFDNWLALLSDDIIYQMPVRINVDGPDKTDYTFDSMTFDDDYYTLKLRVDRLKSEFAWAEIPPSRTRRFVSNVRIKSQEENTLEVFSNLLIYRSRGNDFESDLISGERRDVLKRNEDGWKVLRRYFIIDQTSINTRNLAIFV